LTILVLSRIGVSLPSFNEYLIDNNTHGTSSVSLCDIDGDGKTDLAASVIEENSMVWFHNEGGMPINWTKHIISSTFSAAWGVYTADIDGDGNMDVLGASKDDNQFAWWRNSGASPITWEKHIIRANLPFAHEVYAIDFDSDGHTDVFAAASDCNRILWWRNHGENPITWTEQTIDSTFTGAKSVRVGDIDGDGDNDVEPLGDELRSRREADEEAPSADGRHSDEEVALSRSAHDRPPGDESRRGGASLPFRFSRFWNDDPGEPPRALHYIHRGKRRLRGDRDSHLGADGEHRGGKRDY